MLIIKKLVEMLQDVNFPREVLAVGPVEMRPVHALDRDGELVRAPHALVEGGEGPAPQPLAEVVLVVQLPPRRAVVGVVVGGAAAQQPGEEVHGKRGRGSQLLWQEATSLSVRIF